ncbi:hybrid sensor histidine kinase/response regulator transcription factor [Dyadobacter psychrotolerans]|uniref:histidine kinase n=1 Tax=Dyadobacter psychrotolerans TaxID=2541721 RepID=A0A4R5DLW3_9BACT|nr:hybrid sensor histidine kinase/response regulator transcription factor [Dyadobacter psychrotolerans]TDE15252.1 hybrid sensor histidine kinase/response regulator [Dyadobacter psychrotolerans]
MAWWLSEVVVKNILLTFSFLLFSLAGICQSNSFYFKNYQVSDGLSGNATGDIVQDKKGFMWFASRNGLNRFDGKAFRIFRNKSGDPLSIGSNSVFSLYEDSDEKLWVGTHKGIYIYDPVTENFAAFKALPAGEVRSIRSDQQHNIWFISDNHLYSYSRKSRQLKDFSSESSRIVSMDISPKGNVCISTGEGVVKVYDHKKGIFKVYDIGKLGPKNDDYYNMIVHTVGDSSLMIGTMRRVILFNFTTGSFRDLSAELHLQDEIQIHTVFEKNKYEYWLGTESGLYTLNLKSGKVNHIVKEYYNPYSITDNIVNTIFKDREGGIWISTQFGGINYYSLEYNRFKKYFPQPVNSISGNLIHTIYGDDPKWLWVGTEDAGLNELDLQTGRFKSFLADGKKGSISYRNLHGLVADKDELWIGTYEHGLDVMDLKTKKVIRHYNAGNDEKSFNSNFIVTLYKTRNSDILVGTWTGLFKYNRLTDDFTRIPFVESQVQSIHEDDQGTLWVASYGGGLYYFNQKSNLKGRLRFDQQRPDGLLDNYINSLYQSKDKHIWLCTEHGLSRYDPASKKFTNYRVEEGLADNQVFRVLEDDQGNFWVSTSKGLSMLDSKTGKFTNYTKANGLPSEQFNYNSSYKNDDGTLFFGTVAGLISFNPSTFVKNKYVPPVYITGIQVNNQDLLIGDKNSPLTASAIHTKAITLPFSSSSLSFDVASLSYVNPEMNSYIYQLEGFDNKWITLNNSRKISFSKLPPGHYVLKIKGSNNDQFWNRKETRINIDILPPWWATIWAYLVYGTVIITIVIIVFRYYHLAMTEKNKRGIEAFQIGKEREIYNAKIEFFTNVAHEIRTPLTLIKMPLDKLLADKNPDVQTLESLNMINKNTNRLIDLTNQLLDFRKAEANNFSLNFTKTDINELLNDVFSTFRPIAEQKNLSYKIELPRIGLQAYVDIEACKKIISNLINNAVKYADSVVRIKLLPFNSDDLLFHIEFSNDGTVIGSENRDKIFEPFHRLEANQKQEGTGIGLPLARSLTELHKGKLELKQQGNQQNTFLLSLPIHQDYEMDLKGESVTDQTSYFLNGDTQEALDPSKPAIVIVEDNVEILMYLSRELASAYNIFKAEDGQQAIDVMQRENIHLVISDIMMPVMDGIELCRRMKNDVQFSHIPIILLTAKNSINSKIEGLEVGADAYIEKPFSLDHLSAQITNLINNRNIIKEYFARSPLTHIKGIAFSKADKEFLEQLNSIISSQIADSDLDVDMLSSMMNMSRPTLYRKIKGISDMTPNELINLSRLKRAAELLAESKYKINEVADMVGYSIPTNFSRDFQKQFGVSPSHYVASLQQKV